MLVVKPLVAARYAIAEGGVEPDKEFSYHRHESNLSRSATQREPLVEGPEGRASADRSQRCDVQHAPHRCSATRDGSPAHQAKVALNRSNAETTVAGDDVPHSVWPLVNSCILCR